MIPTPLGWRVHRGGRELMFVPQDGAASIRYEERLRPLAPAGELARVAAAAVPSFRAATRSPAELLETHEGEYALLTTVAGEIDGATAQLDAGFVLLEDQVARVLAVTADAARFAAMTALVRELLLRASYLLGERPRRALYTPPPGWLPVERGLMAEWMPPLYPRERAILTVWPALPTGAGPVGWWHALTQPDLGFVVDAAAGQWQLESAHGLRGHGQRLVRDRGEGEGLQREVVVLRDDRYLYLFRLETPLDAPPAVARAHRQALAGVVGSTHPIPWRRPGPAATGALVGHWID